MSISVQEKEQAPIFYVKLFNGFHLVDDKWMTVLERNVKTEMERISQRLTQRIKELAERYETTLPQQVTEVNVLESKVNSHLQKMGFVWK